MRLGQLFALTTIIAMSACATRTAPSAESNEVPAFASEYRIGIGDSLKVDVYRNADLSVVVTVRPDGMITVPVAGDVLVGGQSPTEVSATIAKALSEYIRDPIVTTTVANMGSSEYATRIRVTGAVTSPQSMPYRNGMTVMDVVLEAGGVNEFANADKTTLYRATGEKLRVRLDRILEAGDMSTNFLLRPGDVVTVPQRIF
jgi:polysaccharide export outer membrane protein